MIRILLIDVGGAFVAKDREKEEEVGGESVLEAEDQEDENEDIEDQGDGEDAALEGPRLCIQMENVEVGFRG